VHFGFVLLLALSTVIELHIKLRRTDLVVKDHEETLMEVMVFCKLGPTALEVHLAVPVIPNFHFIGSSSPRVFAKNCFLQFSSIHKLGKLQRHPLNLMTLSADDAEEGVYLGRRRRRNIMWRSTWTLSSSRNLGLDLASHRAARVPLNRSGRQGYRSLGLVLTTVRAAATSLFHRHADVQLRSTCIGHGDMCWEKKP
jgi:hypothetical protein